MKGGVPCIIAGGRDLYLPELVSEAVQLWLEGHGPICEVVTGAADGMDAAGEAWAALAVYPVRRFPANWAIGRRAGPLRNQEMATYAAARQGGCIVIHHGSAGSRDMLRVAKRMSLKIIDWDVSGLY